MMYVANIAEYNKRNWAGGILLQEQMDLLKMICREPAMAGMPVVVLLNKVDQFKIRLAKRHKFRAYFKDYHGENTPEAVLPFIRERFQACLSGQPVTFNETCATDSDMMRHTLVGCLDACIMGLMKKDGFME